MLRIDRVVAMAHVECTYWGSICQDGMCWGHGEEGRKDGNLEVFFGDIGCTWPEV
jgi:hypothetical protein